MIVVIAVVVVLNLHFNLSNPCSLSYMISVLVCERLVPTSFLRFCSIQRKQCDFQREYNSSNFSCHLSVTVWVTGRQDSLYLVEWKANAARGVERKVVSLFDSIWLFVYVNWADSMLSCSEIQFETMKTTTMTTRTRMHEKKKRNIQSTPHSLAHKVIMFDYLVCILLSGGLFWYWLDFIVYPRCSSLNSQCFYRLHSCISAHSHRHWHTNKVSTLFTGNLFDVLVLMYTHTHFLFVPNKCYFLKSILPIFSILLCNFILFKRKCTRYRRITTPNT